jgi:hypothetical protein
VVDLGNGRLRVGAIQIDRSAGRFELPATVLRHEPPLEFLAIAKGGYKAYESLFELDAGAVEFNLACILVGLDPARGRAAKHHFDPAPAVGDEVAITVSWESSSGRRSVDAADLVRMGEKTLPRGEWVYTGSVFTPDGHFLAALDGTVIGFVHDPSSIIEHRSGFGLGAFGAVMPNADLLPAVGSQVVVRIGRREAAATGSRGAESDPAP